MRLFNLVFEFNMDIKFWAITPNFNINLHSNEFEIEFLCFGCTIYIN